MQIMTEKGVLVRDEDVRPQVYQVAKSRSSTQRQLVSDLLQRAFGGAADKLVLAALSSQRTTPEERAAIQALLDDHARDEGDALEPGDDSGTDADTTGHDEEDRS